ncbi:hypothetical protein [Lederbergia galactosidilytica]|uniref:Uncharacterized protein n=2 Tax=Lederbergia galactosidilytica TaxID=217031 RepID=A0A178A394_9BACI|nr:hypothetical protein [Lederbergia galactosidilytica]KRG12247.1 hypothetical protein ACA30_19355 [Virgibacillus soli]MBP1913953.1 hypothetical protein [Lederbergia galactosidilytica]OAK73990.1 hypothetical protein ABB05_06105 [Lederbergia galactosidilytica]
MYDLLLQESYAEWILPLTIAIIWILSWQLIILSHSVQTNGRASESVHLNIFTMPTIRNDRPRYHRFQLMKTVRRQESPDDADDHHFSI